MNTLKSVFGLLVALIFVALLLLSLGNDGCFMCGFEKNEFGEVVRVGDGEHFPSTIEDAKVVGIAVPSGLLGGGLILLFLGIAIKLTNHINVNPMPKININWNAGKEERKREIENCKSDLEKLQELRTGYYRFRQNPINYAVVGEKEKYTEAQQRWIQLLGRPGPDGLPVSSIGRYWNNKLKTQIQMIEVFLDSTKMSN